jgi:DNA-binding transcriptional regulator YiaG
MSYPARDDAYMDTSETVEIAKLRAFIDSGAAKALRVRRNLSFRETAGPVGVSPSTILRWETGERSPRGDAALRYWRFLQELMFA